MRRNELFTKLIYLLSDENQNFKNTIPKEIFDNIMSYKLLLSLDSLTLSDIEEYFVKHDIDINASDESRQGFLHYSLCHNELNEVIKYFVTKGVNINDQDLIGNTPLYYAALGKNVERIKILLDNGADANISNHRGQKPVNVSTIKETQSLLASATHVEHETTSLGQTTSDGYLSEEV